MVDGRIFYNEATADLNAYGKLWSFLKAELFASPNKAEPECSCEAQAGNYELDPELKKDIDSVIETAEGLENTGKSARCENSTS